MLVGSVLLLRRRTPVYDVCMIPAGVFWVERRQGRIPARQGDNSPLQCMDCQPLSTTADQSELLNLMPTAVPTYYDQNHTTNSNTVELCATNIQCPGVGRSFRIGLVSPVFLLITTMSIDHWRPRVEKALVMVVVCTEISLRRVALTW